MKVNQGLSIKFLSAAALVSAIGFSLALPAVAQVSEELATRAREECIRKAEADGYTVNNVVSVEPDGGATDRVKVVLDLTRDGASAPLTCRLSGDEVAFGDVMDNAAPVDLGRLWWLLLPLLGLPLLLWWANNRRSEYDRYVRPAASYSRQAEGVIRTNGELLDVYSGPGTSYRVVSNLRNGQRVVLTGRQDNNWVELENIGWVPAQYVEADARYARS
jgi:hypothetical protein